MFDNIFFSDLGVITLIEANLSKLRLKGLRNYFQRDLICEYMLETL